jgi:hypothetical protein
MIASALVLTQAALEHGGHVGQTNINVPSDGPAGGYGAGMIVGLVLAILVIGLVVWFFILGGSGGGTTTPPAEEPPAPAPSGWVIRSLG